MDASLKQRLVGAVVLVALAVIFLPMLVKGPAPGSGVTDVPLEIPDGPQVRELSLVAPGPAPQGGATGMPEPMAQAQVAATEATEAETPKPEPTFPVTAAGDYAVGFGSYASAADADKVIAALAKAELTAYREASTINGKQAQRVRIGPFADRAMAESARLRAGEVNPGVDAKVIALDAEVAALPAAAQPEPKTEAAPVARPEPKSEAVAVAKPENKPQSKPEPEAQPGGQAEVAAAPAEEARRTRAAMATTPAYASATGFAVQVGAFAASNEAIALRDKLRAAGFNAFTEPVTTDKGALTRVRVGPTLTRAEADSLQSQVKAKANIDGIVRPHP